MGRDFPVFLHPQTKEEYALARTERQNGKGYHGFVFHTDSKVTIEEDLKRRDLTINAIAENLKTGERVDPFGGVKDLHDKVLRHVSPAFKEDPVRVLRLARFGARFPDFSIAPETFLLCQKMVEEGELAHLVKERVFEELKKGLMEKKPSQMLQFLWDIGAFKEFFTGFVDFSTVNTKDFSKLDEAAHLDFLLNERCAVFCRVFSQDEKAVRQMVRYLTFPKICADSAVLLSHFGGVAEKINRLTAEEWVDFFQFLDVYRRPQRFHSWLKTTLLFENVDKDFLKALCAAFLSVKGFELLHNSGGENMAQKIKCARVKALHHFLTERMRNAEDANH